MRLLVTGAGGFVGQHLLRYLSQIEPDVYLHGTVLNASEADGLLAAVTYHAVDLTQPEAIQILLDDLQPDVIYHLAAQSSPSKALDMAWQTLEINALMQFNLLSACIKLAEKPRLFTVTSGEIYSGTARPEDMPLTEDAPLRPGSPYAVSKAMQDLMALQFYISHQLPVIRIRAFNHTGPGQRESFVAPDFAMQIARIEAGQQEPVMHVGNLSAERDFTDVRDVVRAYHLLMVHGQAGLAYNVASNRAYSVRYLLDTLLSYSDAQIEVRQDTSRLRPVDVPLILGSYDRLHAATGWQPEIPFETTLRDLLDDCRQRVQRTPRSN